MWISKKITSINSKNPYALVGKVTQFSNNSVCAENEVEFRDLPVFCPYGIVSIPTTGSKVFLIPTSSGYLYSGALTQNHENLAAGEIGLYSYGGASLVLKNDGRVLVNGNEIG